MAVGAVLVHREFFSVGYASAKQADLALATAVPGWTAAVNNGEALTNRAARVNAVVFSDLECPVCRKFEGTLQNVRAHHPGVGFVFVHFPLPGHRFAQIAARASECAVRAGRFPQFVEAAYNKQDSLGLKSWGSYSAEAGIVDTVSFDRCVNETTPIARIDSGIAIGHRLGVHGTPTVMVNQWRFNSVPTEQDLDRAIAAAASGKRPF